MTTLVSINEGSSLSQHKLVQDRLIMKMAMEQKARKMGLRKEEKVLTASSPKDQIIRHL